MMYYINRFRSDENGTFGTLMNDVGHQYCYTAEPPATADYPDIPEGKYEVQPYNSPAHGEVWQIIVPGRSYIEIHPGNSPLKDSLGCVLVGNALGNVNGLPAVMNSRDTFAKLKTELPQSFTLTIRRTVI